MKALIPIVRLAHAADLPLPSYATPGSAGFDLIAALEESLCLLPHAAVAIPTGIQMALPTHLEGQIRSRSGMALHHGVAVLNSPGTIDSDYRGEIKVILINHGVRPFVVDRGMRIAQMVIAPFVRVQMEVFSDLPETTRGEGGFGSTGLRAQEAE